MDQTEAAARVPPHPLTYTRPPEPPWWVVVGLWGVPSRAAARMYLWGTVGVAACAVLGFVFPPAWLGVLMLLASAWYWASIRWKDRHGAWRR